jgi:creatinine amidohydrolase
MSHLEAADLPWPALRRHLEADRPLVLGIGSFEQHGPHLPMGTDATIAAALARAVADRCDGLVLPTLGFGAASRPRSGGGDAFPAPALDLPTLLATVQRIAEGAVRAGARRLVVLSWHYENAAVLWDALHAALAGSAKSTALLFDAPWDFLTTELIDELFAGEAPNWASDHAGLLETALMRHLAPDLVGPPPAPEPHVPRLAYDVLPTPLDAVPHTGVVNDARKVGAAAGERAFAAMVDGVAAAIAFEARRRPR